MKIEPVTLLQADPLGLDCRELSLTYRTSRGDLPALGPLDLAVRSGEFVAVLGPSGCGKSSLLKLLSGLLPPTTGGAVLGDTPIAGPRKDVGMVFQQPTLLPWKNVIENVLMPVRVLGSYGEASRREAQELLEMVGLGAYGAHYPHELSGGMQQRVGIARALIHKPKLLLMDEPFAALDALTRESIALDLQAVWERSGKTVILITHSIQEAVFMADRVVVLSGRPGQVIHNEAVHLPRPRGIETMRSPEFMDTCDRLRRLLAHRGTL